MTKPLLACDYGLECQPTGLVQLLHIFSLMTVFQTNRTRAFQYWPQGWMFAEWMFKLRNRFKWVRLEVVCKEDYTMLAVISHVWNEIFFILVFPLDFPLGQCVLWLLLAIVVRYKSRNPWKKAVSFLFEKENSLSSRCKKAGDNTTC